MTPTRRRLIVLGSTGSIGVNTLAVVAHLHELGAASFDIVGLAAGSNAARLREQAARFHVPAVAIAEPNGTKSFDGVKQVFTGDDASEQLVEAVAQPGDLVVGAMVGAAGLPATLRAIERGCDVALANKETLVAAGAIVMPLARKKGVSLIPIDSEHSAIFQCLQAGRAPEEVRRVTLTASGGPFRTWSAERLSRATVAESLNHPTWSMGEKVTIDSASLMNKALEVIEAHWLFDLPAEKIQVVVHPQSIVHSLVEFIDGSVIAQLNPPDMRLPIQYALTWPERKAGCSPGLDLAALNRLDFEPVDRERFPSVDLAFEAIERGGNAGAVLNAANEEAVRAFLAQRIAFHRIPELVAAALRTVPGGSVSTLEDCLAADRAARAFIATELGGEGTNGGSTPPTRSATTSSRAAAGDPLSRGSSR